MKNIIQKLRSVVHEFDPTMLGFLGLLAVPGWISNSLDSLEVFEVFFVFWLWPLVSMLLLSEDEVPVLSRVRVVVSYLYLTINPFVQAQSVAQLVGYVVVLIRYRGHPPATDHYEVTTDLTLPFEGTWTVVNGGTTKADSHSWGIISQRYAYDFYITDENGQTHDGTGTDLDDYYCYGEPILAPADGVVIAANDGRRDSPYLDGWLDPFQRDIRGNYVTIKHTENEYCLLAHLRNGSVAVSEGDSIERGQRIGRCGHSGNSTEPHLHFQLQDRPRWFTAGLPITFPHVTTETSNSTDERDPHAPESISAGQRVAPVSGTINDYTKRSQPLDQQRTA